MLFVFAASFHTSLMLAAPYPLVQRDAGSRSAYLCGFKSAARSSPPRKGRGDLTRPLVTRTVEIPKARTMNPVDISYSVIPWTGQDQARLRTRPARRTPYTLRSRLLRHLHPVDLKSVLTQARFGERQCVAKGGRVVEQRLPREKQRCILEEHHLAC